jgi:hypothetical protein
LKCRQNTKISSILCFLITHTIIQNELQMNTKRKLDAIYVDDDDDYNNEVKHRFYAPNKMNRSGKIDFDFALDRKSNLKKQFESNSKPKAINIMSPSIAECPVCVEPYTGKVRQQVTCASCSYDCCTTCVKSYLLSTSDDPHCMNCRRAWDLDYLYDILSKSFVNTTLRKHRKGLLLEREKAQIPNTQAYVDYLTQKEEKERQMKNIKDQINQLWARYDIASHELQDFHRTQGVSSNTQETHATKLLKCPFPSCRGYLSGSKCNICKHTTCRDCMTITDIDSNGNVVEEEHVCDEEAKKTAQFILKQTKGCPGCGERISKVSGCDQMWCTQCNIAFSWTTGKQITGVIHNPHYYDWLRNNNNAQNQVVRNAGDVVCGGLIDLPRLHGYGLIHTQNINKTYLDITRLHRSINHTQHTIVSKMRRKLNYEINDKLRNYRAKYMMSQSDEETWSKSIMRLDSERQREQALLHIYETYCTIMTERFNNFAEEGRRTKDFKKTFKIFQKDLGDFITYLNTQLLQISNNYNISYYKFNDSGVIQNVKSKA